MFWSFPGRDSNRLIIFHHLCSWALLETMDLVDLKTGCLLSPNLNIINSATLSHWDTTSFLIQIQRMTIFLVMIFFRKWKRVERLIRILVDFLLMSLIIDMNFVRPIKTSGCMLISDKNSWTSWPSCNVVTSGKIFHSNPTGSPWIVSKFCIVMNFWTTSTCPPRKCSKVDSRSSFHNITQNLQTRKPLRARDWRLSHHHPKKIYPCKINH